MLSSCGFDCCRVGFCCGLVWNRRVEIREPPRLTVSCDMATEQMAQMFGQLQQLCQQLVNQQQRAWRTPCGLKKSIPWVVACGKQLRVGTGTCTLAQGVRMRDEATISTHTSLLSPRPSIHTLGVVSALVWGFALANSLNPEP